MVDLMTMTCTLAKKVWSVWISTVKLYVRQSILIWSLVDIDEWDEVKIIQFARHTIPMQLLRPSQWVKTFTMGFTLVRLPKKKETLNEVGSKSCSGESSIVTERSWVFWRCPNRKLSHPRRSKINHMGNVLEIGVNNNIFQHELAPTLHKTCMNKVCKGGMSLVGYEPGIYAIGGL